MLLLATATRMLGENLDSSQLSLNELARQASMAKSNVYRYFESREAVLLEVLRAQWAEWFDAYVSEVRGRSALSIEEVAHILAETAAVRPVLCHLTSVMPSVLEHNISEATVRQFKEGSLEFMTAVAQRLADHCHELSAEQFRALLHRVIAIMVGLWPLSNPSKAVAQVLEDPKLAEFRHDFSAELESTVVLIARGMMTASMGTRPSRGPG